ncbi:Ig-like domain-containing protein [Agromyces silvae]|uniref:Ig-like domain-containing protein n=1 Tax=Agromyces silvae TaxID=3388266 RepID=UPI00280C1574|nr:Ig-like domain-containing protein [Agromyces protaetiae]
MTASSPRPPRSRRLIGIGAATLLAVPASLILATPAHAAEPGSATFTSASVSEWTVPAGVREVIVTAIGGSGGNAAGQHGGVGGVGASVESVLAVEPGDVLDIWAGQAGGNAGGGRTENGAGGTGFVAGGNGASSGASARPGAGGGGASAVAVNDEVLVIAGGGGGGGGRGADDSIFFDACYGGAGGAAGSAGAASWTTNNPGCSDQAGGAAGADAYGAGGNASNVELPNLQRTLGGSGGGGAGAGAAGAQQTSGLIRTAGGGGGGGGASLGDTVGVAAAAGNGSVSLEWEVAYTTALEVNASPEPSVIGETVSYTVLVENTETTDASPVGDVTLDFGNGDVVTAPLEATGTPNLASATVERTAVALGTQSVSASYTPTEGSPFAPAEGGTEFTVEKGDTLTVLDVKPTDPAYFHHVRATATVSVVEPAVAPLSGYVAFFNGEDLVGIVAVDPVTGEAFVDFTVTEVGETNVVAYYGDDVLLNNSDDLVTYNAHAASTTTTLKASSKEVAHGGKVKFEAAVVANLPAPLESDLPETGGDLPGGDDVVVTAAAVDVAAAATPVAPAGVVRFVAGDKVLGEVALSANGTAVFETASLASGTHEVVAHFVSSVPEFASSKSEAVKVTVAAAKAGLASTGVDAGLLGGSALLAALLIGLGATFMIRRRQTA